MSVFRIQSCSIIICISLAISVVCGSSQAVEIHVVGDAAYKNIDGEWIKTSGERFGDINAIWAFTEDDIFIGDEDGAIFHFDGQDWNCIFVDPDGEAIKDIWGTSDSNLYVCVQEELSSHSKFMHFDGSVWSEIVLPYQSRMYLSVYGFSEDDIYMVGNDPGLDNIIYHNDSGDPQSWDLVNIHPPIPDLELNCTCIWGSSGDDVFVGDSGGDILHYDGHSWELMESGTLDYIEDIWGISENDLFAVTALELLRYDGDAWTEMPVPLAIYMDWIRGTSNDDLLVGGYGDKILHYDGSDWSQLPNEDLSYSKDAFMFSSGYALIVDLDGKLFRYNGSAIDRIDQEYWIMPLMSVSGTATNSVYAGAAEGFVYRYDGDSWSDMARPSMNDLNDIIAFSDDDIVVLSQDEVFHFDGMSWELIGSGDMGGVEMWGTSSDNFYTVGGGRVYHYDGDDWEELLYSPYVCYDPPLCEEGNATYYNAIWGASDDDVYVGGCYHSWGWELSHPVSYKCHIALNYDGAMWHDQDLPITCPYGPEPDDRNWIDAIWGSSATDIWAGGNILDEYYSSYVLHFDGVDWSAIDAPFSSCSDIWGSSSDDIYFLDGAEGDIYHYNGADFSLVDLTHVQLRDICSVDYVSTPAEAPSPIFNLSQNHPNPFNPSTTISFSLKSRDYASLAIYDVAGRLVRVLIDGVKEAGPHDVTWDGRDKAGRGVASGVYFYRLEAGEFVETKKMVLLR